MVADSTQSELADAADGKKKKKKTKKAGKKVTLPEDEDSDLDLKKELKPIGAFVKDRGQMVEEMFHAVRGASLQRALPDLLKTIPMDELKQLCLEQLEVMSKKRIRRILAGEESANISSSGTEDDTTDEETAITENLDQLLPPKIEPDVEGHPADSTSVHQEHREAEERAGQELTRPPEQTSTTTTAANEQLSPVQVKQEPPDSGDEVEDHDRRYRDENYDRRRYEDDEYDRREEEDEYDYDDDYGDDDDDDDDDDEPQIAGEEDPPETYTSGSEDGELVPKEVQPMDTQSVTVKQEPMSDDEKEEQASAVGATGGKDGEKKDEEEQMEEDTETLEEDLLSSVQGGEDELPPSIMVDQMELLELEMRARAIKAMLSSHEEGDT